MVDFHVDGDVGIGDLVFASTYWNQERRQWNEYSQYEQNFNAGAKNTPPTGYPGTQEGFTCLNDPYYGGGPFTGCKPPTQYYSYNINPQRWSNELRLSSKPGGRFHWLAGLYWERTVDNNYGNTYYMPGLQYQGAAFQYYLNYYQLDAAYAAARSLVRVHRDAPTTCRPPSSPTSVSTSPTSSTSRRAPCTSTPTRRTTRRLAFAYAPNSPSDYSEQLAQVGQQVRHQLQDHRPRDGVRRFGPGLPRRRQQFRMIRPSCYSQRRAARLHARHAQQLRARLEDDQPRAAACCGTARPTTWTGRICRRSSTTPRSVPPRATTSTSAMRASTAWNRTSTTRSTSNWTFQASVNYTDVARHLRGHAGLRRPTSTNDCRSRRTSAGAGMGATRAPVSSDLHGYLQFDMAHKGDMCNGLNPDDKNTRIAAHPAALLHPHEPAHGGQPRR